MRKFIPLFLLLVALFALPAAAEAAQLPVTLTVSSGAATAPLADGKESTYLAIPAGGSLTVDAGGSQIAGVYLVFDKVPGEWQCATDTGITFAAGQHGFLHEYVEVPAAARGLTLSFPVGAVIAECSAWSAGDLPDSVQVWQPAYAEADLLLFSTHSDDEHLFFAGILPDCIDRGLAAQVVYMTQHFDTHNRPHEQLNGLWAVGVRNYPIVGPFPDLYSTSLAAARTIYAGRGYEEDDFIAYAVEQIRRFRPQVVIGHDVNGEYNHGAHIVNTAALQAALEISADPTAYPDSAAAWGTWDVPKTYLHLWPERTVTMNWDKPLDFYGGKTAFEVSNLGYNEHYSQHWTWFTRWIRGTTAAPITAAAQITTYSPCAYGLWRTTVGDDTPGVNDFFEHITPYAEQIPPEPETTAPPETTAAPVTTEAPVTTAAPATAGTTVPAGTAPAIGEAEGLPIGVILPIGIVVILIIAVGSVLGPVGRRK
ncbi:MAG: PIG-L family deacetylase [Clostridia bacterium]|nr:PIG-L family deacetylase [Clostridia bacterium]